MRAIQVKTVRRERRRLRVRARIRRTTELPRLVVSRSLKHIQAQIVDAGGRTLAHASSTSKELAGDLAGKKKSERAAVIGALVAQRALAAGVERVVLDRGSSRFHGRVKALAEAARAGGLRF